MRSTQCYYCLKVVEEVQEGVQEIEDEKGEKEVGWNGELKVEE